jgi:hypothetical protein
VAEAGSWGDWIVVEDGVYFFEVRGAETGLHFLDLGSGEEHMLVALDAQKYRFSVSPDERFFVYGQLDEMSGDLVLLEP